MLQGIGYSRQLLYGARYPRTRSAPAHRTKDSRLWPNYRQGTSNFGYPRVDARKAVTTSPS